jgi:hypothetical protein
MDLPKWDVLKLHYPALDAGAVFKSIGGKVEQNYNSGVFTNACATRVSKALNGAGGVHSIPYFKDIGPTNQMEPQVSSGKNKNWYIFRVRMLVKYLKSKYGKPQELAPSEYKKVMKDKKGIIVFEVSGWADATGHADLWDGSQCLWHGYGGMANKILFWEAS